MEGREILYLIIIYVSIMSVFVCISVYCFIVCANIFKELKVSSLCCSWKYKLSRDLSTLLTS